MTHTTEKLLRTFFPLVVLFASVMPGLPADNSRGENYPVAQLEHKGEVSVEGKIQLALGAESRAPLVYSGNRIEVGSGEARLEMILGGSIKLFSRSGLSILQNHSPFLFTLSQGEVAFDLHSSRGDGFFTPDFLVKTQPDPRNPKNHFRGEIALEAGGALCVRSLSGVLQISTQDQQSFLMVPPGSSLRILPGTLTQAPAYYAMDCACAGKSKPKPEDYMKSFRPAFPQPTFWKSLRTALRKALHVVSLGLI
jgi:hypothetical protein